MTKNRATPSLVSTSDARSDSTLASLPRERSGETRRASRGGRKRKALGVGLIAWGIIALLTPLTPGSWLAIIGLELFGVHLFAGGPAGLRDFIHKLTAKIEKKFLKETKSETDRG